MGYNTSRHVVVRLAPYLDAMLRERRTLIFQSSDPERLAYDLREARNAVAHHKEFGHYVPLRSLYRFRARQGYLEAEYIGPTDPTEPKDLKVFEESLATTVPDVVTACVALAPDALEVYFPRARLSEDDLLVLYSWAKRENPPWLIINHYDEGITLTRRTGVPDEFVWRPQGTKARPKNEKGYSSRDIQSLPSVSQ